ncbi:MAG: hypothetical protein HFH41_00910 [Lachnospiraceae bacterium]|nr:hypothetical protein [Lachnospiraceae bacterium]
MLYNSNEMEQKGLLATAAKMCVAARTAPKAKGVDYILTLVLTGEEKDLLVEKMETISKRLGEAQGGPWFHRDASNVQNSDALLLVGAKKSFRGVSPCSLCGFENCGACQKAGGVCGHLLLDLGIALSSAAAAAAQDKVDTRMMWSVGKAAEEMHYTEEDACWVGIPLSVSGKNIFFDRK